MIRPTHILLRTIKKPSKRNVLNTSNSSILPNQLSTISPYSTQFKTYLSNFKKSIHPYLPLTHRFMTLPKTPPRRRPPFNSGLIQQHPLNWHHTKRLELCLTLPIPKPKDWVQKSITLDP
ncbi:hypothetical protein RCL_jg24724.t1 [Rhizophagus clarus]|uniref:Uncharacterized protein n=1 Tax=Rhizophagus clarus TaxID=94130 RepID=A0A8H3R020_9GLOM|nr:hypothetical protein RCL_jg24724.t1 [Rhizophagus clarus]